MAEQLQLNQHNITCPKCGKEAFIQVDWAFADRVNATAFPYHIFISSKCDHPALFKAAYLALGGRLGAPNKDVELKKGREKPFKINAAKCLGCGDIIESKHVHDFKRCSCGAIAVDGGLDYLRRVGDLNKLVNLSGAKIEAQRRRA